MYFVDKEGVTNLETNQIIEIGTDEWSIYKKWCSEGNQPKFGKPYIDDSLISVPEIIEDTNE